MSKHSTPQPPGRGLEARLPAEMELNRCNQSRDRRLRGNDIRLQAEQLCRLARDWADHGKSSAGRQRVEVFGNGRWTGKHNAVDTLRFENFTDVSRKGFYGAIHDHDVDYGAATA